jgi:hypothetical protein
LNEGEDYFQNLPDDERENTMNTALKSYKDDLLHYCEDVLRELQHDSNCDKSTKIKNSKSWWTLDVVGKFVLYIIEIGMQTKNDPSANLLLADQNAETVKVSNNNVK